MIVFPRVANNSLPVYIARHLKIHEEEYLDNTNHDNLEMKPFENHSRRRNYFKYHHRIPTILNMIKSGTPLNEINSKTSIPYSTLARWKTKLKKKWMFWSPINRKRHELYFNDDGDKLFYDEVINTMSLGQFDNAMFRSIAIKHFNNSNFLIIKNIIFVIFYSNF